MWRGDLPSPRRGAVTSEPPPQKRRMDAGSMEEENAQLQERLAEELTQAECCQGQYEALLGRQAQLRARLQAQSLESLERAARALQEELEEVQSALQEWKEEGCRHQHHIHQREKENQRLAETLQELQGKVWKQRAREKTHKQDVQQLRVQGVELQRQLWDMETKYQSRAARIREKQRQVTELSVTLQGLSRRIQVLHRNISCWGDQLVEAQQDAELFQRQMLHGPLGTPPSCLLWEERARDQTEKLLFQESGGAGRRGRLSPRLWAAGWLLWALAKALFLALLGTLALGTLHALLSRQSCPPPAGAWLYVRPKATVPS